MKKWQIVLSLAATLVLASAAEAQTNVRVRGTITAVEGNVLSIKSRDGRDLKVELADNVAVAVAKAIRLDDIKRGDYVGVTTKPGADNTPVALEVHYLSPTTPEGQLAWDLEPGTTMTNANVEAIVQSAGNAEMTLHYKGGTQKVRVPDG